MKHRNRQAREVRGQGPSRLPYLSYLFIPDTTSLSHPVEDIEDRTLTLRLIRVGSLED